MPTPAAGEVLVKVVAVAANFPDVLLCRGEYQVKPDLPFTPGIELAGVVAALGDGVSPDTAAEPEAPNRHGVDKLPPTGR